MGSFWFFILEWVAAGSRGQYRAVDWPARIGGRKRPIREELSVGSLRVHTVDVPGTLKASRIGSFPSTDLPGYRLLGAIVEGEGGPWFLRLVAPGATAATERDAFISMLEGLES